MTVVWITSIVAQGGCHIPLGSTIFVAKEDLKVYKRISEVIKTKVETNPSQMAIVFGRGERAVQVVLKILKEIKADSRNYVIEIQQSGYQLSGFIFAPEVRARVASRWDTLTGEP